MPIVKSNWPAIRQLGTGTLFKIADRHFVVTAGHVLDDAAKNDATLAIGGSDGRFVVVGGGWIKSAPAEAGDLYDIAVHVLSEPAVARLSGAAFLRLSDVSFDSFSNHRFFALFGFPQIWATPSDKPSDEMKFKALQFSTFKYSGTTSGLQGYDPTVHLLLDAQDERVFDESGADMEFRLRQGIRASFPGDLEGISGCSVWKLGSEASVHDWKPEDARLVAVQTGVYRERKVIKATRWAAVTTLIHQAYPELRPALALHCE